MSTKIKIKFDNRTKKHTLLIVSVLANCFGQSDIIDGTEIPPTNTNVV